MSVALLAEIVCWVFVAVGLAVAVFGGFFGGEIPAAFGTCLTFYSLTGENYVPLLTSPDRTPISTAARTWGATSAVIGGCALVGVVLALQRRRDRRADATFDETRVDIHLQRRVLFLALMAGVSIAIIHLGLSKYDLAPSANFLTDYSNRPGVFIYELVFAIWIMYPVFELARAALGSPEVGYFRWLVVIGGVTGLAWGTWKIVGVFVLALTGDHVPVESPISVSLGLVTLVTIFAGLVGSVGSTLVFGPGWLSRYRARRAEEDRTLRLRGRRRRGDAA